MGRRIALFPLHAVLLPTVDLGIHVFEQRYRELVADVLAADHTFGVVLIEKGREVGGPAVPHPVGTLAQISAHAMLPDGRYLLEVEGAQRFRVHETHDDLPYPSADVSFMSESIGNFGGAKALGADVARLLDRYRHGCGNGGAPDRLPSDPVTRSYLVASLLQIDTFEKQRLLEMTTAEERLSAERDILLRELALLEHLQRS